MSGVKSDANFFKHANNEAHPNASIEFDPVVNEVYMLMSLIGLNKLGAAQSDEIDAFLLWLSVHEPTYFAEGFAENRIPAQSFAKIRSLNKREFFEDFVSARRIARNGK